jgi:hypothetical protein
METPYHKMELKFAGIDMLQDEQHYGTGTGSWSGLPIHPATDHRRSVERTGGRVEEGSGQRQGCEVNKSNGETESKQKKVEEKQGQIGHKTKLRGIGTLKSRTDGKGDAMGAETELDDTEVDVGGGAPEEAAEDLRKGLSAMSTSVNKSSKRLSGTELVGLGGQGQRDRDREGSIAKPETRASREGGGRRRESQQRDDEATATQNKDAFVSPAITIRDKVKRYMYATAVS